MAELPPLSPGAPPRREPLTIPLPAGCADHRFEGRAVLPAVLALEALAARVGALRPDLPPSRSAEAEFLRFAPLPEDAAALEAVAELSPGPDGETVRAALLTVRKVGRAGITRSLEHVRLTLGGPAWQPPRVPEATGQPLSVSPEELYRPDGGLVPFGPAFHTVVGPTLLTPERAEAEVLAAPWAGAGALGSPLPLDAALHLCCAFGQRFAGVVTFPVGFARRQVLRPTRSGERYRALIWPSPGGSGEPGVLSFEIALFDRQERLCEALGGVRMADVSRGRMRPPAWIRAGGR